MDRPRRPAKKRRLGGAPIAASTFQMAAGFRRTSRPGRRPSAGLEKDPATCFEATNSREGPLVWVARALAEAVVAARPAFRRARPRRMLRAGVLNFIAAAMKDGALACRHRGCVHALAVASVADPRVAVGCVLARAVVAPARPRDARPRRARVVAAARGAWVHLLFQPSCPLHICLRAAPRQGCYHRRRSVSRHEAPPPPRREGRMAQGRTSLRSNDVKQDVTDAQDALHSSGALEAGGCRLRECLATDRGEPVPARAWRRVVVS